ncbi:MAG: serine/threonine protein kinase [Planctomycetota bacterium]|jgi:serine/threonine-protein kinase
MATESEMKLLIEAMKAGLLLPEKIQEGLNLQKELSDKGKNVPILNILVKKEFLSRDAARCMVLEHKLAASEEQPTFQPIKGYKLKKLLGKGGVARVFLAERASDGINVALKVQHPLQNLNKTFVERFINEARLLKEFDSPHVVKGLDYGESGELYYLAMELLEGESVQDRMDREGIFDEDTALFIIVQIAKALEYCQGQGILHRDIKPDNIMVTQKGGIKLCDLGFAKPIEENAEEEDTTCGTPQYISPEQARGSGDVDIRADIYSLGATLFHMAVGEVPFAGDDSMEVMAKQILEDLSTSKHRNISMHMQYFVEKMMAKERDIRYQTARELIEDIETQIKGKKTLVFDPNLKDVDLDTEEGLFSRSGKRGKTPGKDKEKPRSKGAAKKGRRDAKGAALFDIKPRKRRR